MDFISKLCDYYHISHDEYEQLIKKATLDDLPSPALFQDMDKACQIIKEAMANQEKIMVYGDYDADGILATSILVNTFNKLHYHVGYYIPSRYIDGYGLNEEKVLLAYEKGYKLIITVDNGVSQHAAIAKAYELGMKVIITDHHSLPSTLPHYEVILHPTYSHYGDTVCCGAYVALMLSKALLDYYDHYLVCLASIATISDMMELKAYNRTIVKLGLDFLKEEKYKNLFMLIKENQNCLDESTYGVQIAPKINAIGRIIENTAINRLVTFFSTDNETEMINLANWIEEVNNERKKITQGAASKLIIDESKPAICIISDEKEGLIGLIANRLLQQYNKPVIVFARGTEEGILKASARSHQGFSIVKCFQSLHHLLEVAGGHDLAGGCSIKEENFEEFQKQFYLLAEQYQIQEEKMPAIKAAIEDITLHNYEILRLLGPFGMGWKAPLFSLENLDIRALSYSKNNLHIMSELSLKTRLVGFNISKDSLADYRYLDVIGHLSLNYYYQQITLQFVIDQSFPRL